MAYDAGEPDLARILMESPTVAVLGAHVDEGRAGFYVPAYLHGAGYRVLPVNPRFVGEVLWAVAVSARLADLREAIDLVDVFRRADAIDAHVPEILAMDPRPRVVWFQSGIRNDGAAAALRAAGLEVVQDHCTLAEHRRLGLGAPRRRPPPAA
ncbi:MAG TPA: CoA-binding protein [Myxococcota bacterium]|jgi:hypothetical protein|nr:CoA-binding protein [Myxococcota bacterium]